MTTPIGRRTFLLGATVLSASVTAACATSQSQATRSASAAAGSGDASGALTIQSNQSDPTSEKGMKALVDAFVATKAGAASLNTVAGEQFRTQLPTYLSSTNPPDVLTWLAGKSSSDYAADGLLLDLSDVWKNQALTSYPESIRKLCTAADGKQVLVPSYYYWWAVYYRKSKFQQWGVTPPKTWEEFKAVCATLQSKGVPAIEIGLSDTPWLASAWFDYLNIRINGAAFHRDVLGGKASFADPKVANVMNTWKEVLPYFDKNAKGLALQEAQSRFFQGKSGMFLIGSWGTTSAPASVKDDLDFFQFPIIDPSVPLAEEGPVDGFFAPAKCRRPKLAKAFLEFAASPAAQETYLKVSGSTFLPANPKATFADTEANRKGKAILDSAKDITQFFNRDGGDELQPTADTALVRFMDQPNDIPKILADWQAAAEKVRKG